MCCDPFSHPSVFQIKSFFSESIFKVNLPLEGKSVASLKYIACKLYPQLLSLQRAVLNTKISNAQL